MANVKNFMVGNDQNTIDQINTFATSEAYKNSIIRIMPDAHAGKGAVVGSTMTFNDKIVPATVGVDIACRVSAFSLGKKEIDLKQFDQEVREKVPTGFNVRPEQSSHSIKFPYEELRCWKYLKNHERLRLSMGTLGAGNHYIELDKNPENGNYWLVVHSGSRNLGLQVCNFYQKLAIEHCAGKGIPNDLCYIEGRDMQDYLNDMRVCNEFSYMSHITMFEEITKGQIYDDITCIHNYVDTNLHIIRKGAIAAYEGDYGLIPLNMRDGILIVRAKGKLDWNCSLPHGAGRIMSRTQARKALSLTDFQQAMEGIYSSSIGESTIDEAPMVYKDASAIIEAIKPNADIIAHLVPVWNYKAV